MKKRLFSLLAMLLCALFVFGMAACAPQSDDSGEGGKDPSDDPIVTPEPETPLEETYADYIVSRSELPYDSVIGIPVEIITYCALPAESVTASTPVVVYVIHHGEERVGGEPDTDIVKDLLKEYILVVLDYQGSPFAVSPQLEQSVMAFKNEVIKSGKYLSGLKYDTTGVHVVPSGSRIMREIVYFDLMASGAKGSTEFIVDVWNSAEVKKKVGSKWKQVTSISEIPMKKGGEMLDAVDKDGVYKYLTYRMDIIYPSKPVKKAPMVLFGSSSYYRNNITGSPDHADRIQYIGFLMKGYATACYDHEYVPFMNGLNGWGHINVDLQDPTNNRDYSMCFGNGVKTHTAAVRCAKYYAEQCGYSSEKVGVYGHSKAAWCSVLSKEHPETFPEERTYAGYAAGENYGEQPYLNYESGGAISSDVTCVYYSMGFGSQRYGKIAATDNRPTIISCGRFDEYDNWSYWYEQMEAYRVCDAEYLALSMYDLGHTIAPYQKDPDYGYIYYDAFMAFFDYYLKDAAPALLYTSADKSGEGRGLFLQFSAPVTEESVKSGVTVLDGEGNAVACAWRSEAKGNRWMLDTALPVGFYTLKVTNRVQDKNGRAIAETRNMEFTVS